MVQEAIRFAEKVHAGQVRKGTNRPYIAHPLAAADIVSNIQPDEILITAAILHDTVEDCDVTLQELTDLFGFRVASIVAAETDDKSLSWRERKRKKLKELENASEDVKIVALGDKLANLRDIAGDYAQFGDLLWDRAYAGSKDLLGWYYVGLRRALFSLAYLPYYQEFSVLVTGLFETERREALIS